MRRPRTRSWRRPGRRRRSWGAMRQGWRGRVSVAPRRSWQRPRSPEASRTSRWRPWRPRLAVGCGRAPCRRSRPKPRRGWLARDSFQPRRPVAPSRKLGPVFPCSRPRSNASRASSSARWARPSESPRPRLRVRPRRSSRAGCTACPQGRPPPTRPGRRRTGRLPSCSRRETGRAPGRCRASASPGRSLRSRRPRRLGRSRKGPWAWSGARQASSRSRRGRRRRSLRLPRVASARGSLKPQAGPLSGASPRRFRKAPRACFRTSPPRRSMTQTGPSGRSSSRRPSTAAGLAPCSEGLAGRCPAGRRRGRFPPKRRRRLPRRRPCRWFQSTTRRRWRARVRVGCRGLEHPGRRGCCRVGVGLRGCCRRRPRASSQTRQRSRRQRRGQGRFQTPTRSHRIGCRTTQANRTRVNLLREKSSQSDTERTRTFTRRG